MRAAAQHRLRQPASVLKLPTITPVLLQHQHQHQHQHIAAPATTTRQRGCRRCHAASSESADSHQQQPSSAGSKSCNSKWGSSWSSKRPSGGSVFSKQKRTPTTTQQQQPQQQQPAADSEQQPKLDPQLEASIRMNVERANQMLQEIVQEVLGELLVEEASAYVLGQEEADLQLNQAVRGAVVKRLEWLDSNFLAAVNAFLAVPGVRSNPELANLLQAVRDETLQLVAARLPPPVQVLNAALALSKRAERDGVVQQALGGGRGEVPGTTLDALGAAAHQLIDDMEDQQVVADRVLLARLVLLREELRMIAERQSAQQFWQEPGGGAAADAAAGSSSSSSNTDSSSSSLPFFAFHRSNLPARCAAFLKNLLAVQERNKRLGLLNRTFQEDWIAEQPDKQDPAAGSSSKAADTQPSFSQQRAQMRDTNFGQAAAGAGQKQDAPDIVRPGRLLTTLHAMRQELEVQLVASGADSAAGAEALTLLRRLEDIRVEALVALDRVQQARPGGGGDKAEADSALYDYELDLQEHDAAVQAFSG